MENTQLGTTIEQSEKLIESGLNPNTADLHYNNNSINGPNYIDEPVLNNFPYTKAIELYRNIGFTENLFFKCIPSWSIGALWDIIHQSKLKFEPDTLYLSSEKLVQRLVDFIVSQIVYTNSNTLAKFITSEKLQ